MRAFALLLGVLAIAGAVPAVGVAGIDASESSVGPNCTRYCVGVTPREGGQGTVFRFTGRGWRPRRAVESLYGTFCDRVCEDDGRVARIRTDRRGRWSFSFREGPPERSDRAAGIVSGSTLSYFEQWTGRPYFSRLVRRKAPHRIESEFPISPVLLLIAIPVGVWAYTKRRRIRFAQPRNLVG